MGLSALSCEHTIVMYSQRGSKGGAGGDPSSHKSVTTIAKYRPPLTDLLHLPLRFRHRPYREQCDLYEMLKSSCDISL